MRLPLFILVILPVLITGLSAAPPFLHSHVENGKLYVNEDPYFIVGAYNSRPKADDMWTQCEEDGINTIISYCLWDKDLPLNLTMVKEYMDNAYTARCLVLFSLKDLYNVTGAEEAVITLVNAVKEHPALLGYYINDEFKHDRIPELEKRRDLVSSLDPNHVTYSVINDWTNIQMFRNTSDVIGVDRYPWSLPNSSLLPIVDPIGSLMKAYSGISDRTMMPVSQIHDLAVYNPGKGYVEPPYAVKRVMAWAMIAITGGSGGQFLYSYFDLRKTEGGKPAPESVVTRRMAEFKNLTREILDEFNVLNRETLDTTTSGCDNVVSTTKKTLKQGEYRAYLANLDPIPCKVSLVAAGFKTEVEMEGYGVAMVTLK